jgi:hypothetical protein
MQRGNGNIFIRGGSPSVAQAPAVGFQPLGMNGMMVKVGTNVIVAAGVPK